MSGETVTNSDTRAAPAVKAAYLCSQYPAVSHTFVLREIEALRALGAEIATFSIRQADPDQLLARADRVAFDSTYAIFPPRWAALIAAQLKLLVRAPAAYLSTLALALRLSPAGLRGRVWQIFYFVEAVVLWTECNRRDIRHVHVHMANVASDVALLTAHMGSAIEPRRPWSWSFTLHGPAELFDVGHYRLAEKLQYARFVVCISDFTRSQLMSLCHPDLWDKLHVVHVGIPIKQFTPTGNGAMHGNETRILFIGRHVPEKGHAVLLEAATLLIERGYRVSVTLGGEGSLRPTLERLARQLGIAAQVRFPGAVGQEEIHGMYAEASIFCLPSFAEGLPGVLMEAMAMRLPVVSTRITGVPELIDDGHTGLLVQPGRPDLLADALERLLTDPALCSEMGANAREKVIREFSTDRSAQELYTLFQRELIDAGKAPA